MRNTWIIFSIALLALIGFVNVNDSFAEESFVNVPGGLKKGDINRLMTDAKLKCYDLGYKIVNEDKDSGYLIAEQLINKKTWTMIIKINGKGFSVKHNANDITSRFNPYFNKWRDEVEATLLKSAEKES